MSIAPHCLPAWADLISVNILGYELLSSSLLKPSCFDICAPPLDIRWPECPLYGSVIGQLHSTLWMIKNAPRNNPQWFSSQIRSIPFLPPRNGLWLDEKEKKKHFNDDRPRREGGRGSDDDFQPWVLRFFQGFNEQCSEGLERS